MTRDQEDIVLWEKLKKGDHKSLEILFLRYYDHLLALANSYLNNDDAEEVISDVFFQLWFKKEQINIRVSLKVYLYKATRNRCLNIIKHNKKKDEKIRSISEYNLHQDNDQPDQLLIYEQTKKQLEVFIEELPLQCKTVFRLSRYDDLSHKEISEILDISVHTVNTQMYRALKYLKSKLPLVNHTLDL